MEIKTSDKLDCLLINPPMFYERADNIWKEINSNFPPLGLASIAGYLSSMGISVNIIDCNIDSPSVQDFEELIKFQYLKKFEDIRIIGITAMTCTIKKAYKIASICRHYYPKAKIVFGGVHPTYCYDEVLGDKNIDIVVIGEGELTFYEIVKGLNIENINGIAFIDQSDNIGHIIKTPNRERIQNLNVLPLPAYNLLPINKYRPARGSYKRIPAMSMITSRGCPGKCTFCSKTLGNQLVFKSAERIFEEIQYLINNYGIKQILFYDDTFTVWKENVKKLCELLIENKIDITWTCFARVDYIDFNLLQLMHQAGCHQIMYGVENINEIVLKNINKKINKEQVIKAVKWTKSAGIECRLAFTIGNPGDTKEIVEENIKFAIEVDPDLIIVNITTPFPGTEMFKWAKEKDLIITYDWDNYDLSQQILRLPNLNEKQTADLYKLMYRRFYFRPKIILKKVFAIRSMYDIHILFDGMHALMSFFTKKA